ncbi:MAG: PaaI family thioesterase [Lachnospiraceae bacterium]|nr:PaaI family thioesterase [Lachnospiraceae bacterium]
MEEHLKKIMEYFSQCKKDSLNEMACPVFVSCDREGKHYLAGYNPDERTVNPNGVIHGGWIATVMDNAMGIFANYYGEGRMTQTVSFQISYLRPGIVGKRLMVKTYLMKQGKTMQYLNAEAWMEGREDKPVATATGVYYTKEEKSEDHSKNPK